MCQIASLCSVVLGLEGSRRRHNFVMSTCKVLYRCACKANESGGKTREIPVFFCLNRILRIRSTYLPYLMDLYCNRELQVVGEKCIGKNGCIAPVFQFKIPLLKNRFGDEVQL